MTAVQEEITSKPEFEIQELDANSQEGSGETTKELFRREESPQNEEGSVCRTPKTSTSLPSSPRPKTPSKIAVKTSKTSKKDETIKKKSSSGIPLRLKSGSNTITGRNEKKMGRYRHSNPQPGPVINRNTLEMQFMNNKKRLLQLHSELVEKQRPLLDMHKSLLRTKKQLEELGKKVVLEDLKIVSLKTEDLKTTVDSSDECPTTVETATTLKNSIDSVLDACKKCLAKRDNVIHVLEDISKSVTESESFGSELEELKRETEDLEKSVESTFKENEAKISELLNNWQKTIKVKHVSNEDTDKIAALEETVAQQQKALSDTEDNMHSLMRKFEDKKTTYEKTIIDLQDKANKLEEELKKEKRTANENIMKARNMRTKVMELEVRTKEAEEKHNETLKKLSQLQEQIRKKEVQWLKEKDDFKKNEQLLQEKFSEKQSQFDTRLKEMERLQKSSEIQQQNFYRTVETQLEIKDQELVMLEKEKEELVAKTNELEKQLEERKKEVEAKEKEIEELNSKKEAVPAIEYKPDENHWVEIMEYKQKINEMQNSIQDQSEQISKMQSSLKAHAQLAAALKLEKDNAVQYSNKLRDILQEARDEIDFKNKTIYKIHEKLVLKDKACDKMKAELKEYQSNKDYFREKWGKNRCQICMSSLGDEKTMDCSDAEVSKSIKSGPQYVSDSLIGMSVKKVDHLRARLDNLKKMKLPFSLGENHPDILDDPFSGESDQSRKTVTNHLRKQIALRGKLYQILQKHADQSCEDFINLLKMTMSKGARDAHELKPSNTSSKSGIDGSYSPNIKITESFSQYVGRNVFNQIYDNVNESFMYDDDEVYF